eukprot:jgi/Chrpa1/25989/Chrysochromulina_OHIO_Genome00003053-RA
MHLERTSDGALKSRYVRFGNGCLELLGDNLEQVSLTRYLELLLLRLLEEDLTRSHRPAIRREHFVGDHHGKDGDAVATLPWRRIRVLQMLQVRRRTDGGQGIAPLDEVGIAHGESLKGVSVGKPLLARTDDVYHAHLTQLAHHIIAVESIGHKLRVGFDAAHEVRSGALQHVDKGVKGLHELRGESSRATAAAQGINELRGETSRATAVAATAGSTTRAATAASRR